MNDFNKMIIEDDFRDMIAALLEENVQFLLIGGYAVSLHGYQRMTKDIDFWVLASPENSVRLMSALEKFGAPTHDISAKDFEIAGTNYQIGVIPVRIDIITKLAGVEFEEAYQNMNIIEVDGLKIPVISITDLIANKKAAGRDRDLVDVRHLEVILKRKSQK
jgi:predicted nucleotidyltransferase